VQVLLTTIPQKPPLKISTAGVTLRLSFKISKEAVVLRFNFKVSTPGVVEKGF